MSHHFFCKIFLSLIPKWKNQGSRQVPPNIPNPFVKTRSMCAGQEEDHLTEFIAGALDACEQFRAAYADFLLGDFAARRGWGPLRIDSVQTQVDHDGNVPDLVLGSVDSQGKRHAIAVEHKIFTKESRRSIRIEDPKGDASEEAIAGQLER